MRVSAKQYAQTLYELAKGKNEPEVKDIIGKFADNLTRNNQLKISEKIIEKFKEIWNEKHGIVEAEVITREEVSTEVRTQVRTYVSNKYEAKEVVINNKIDESIKGGLIIKVRDEILDASVSNSLKNLKISLLR